MLINLKPKVYQITLKTRFNNLKGKFEFLKNRDGGIIDPDSYLANMKVPKDIKEMNINWQSKPLFLLLKHAGPCRL